MIKTAPHLETGTRLACRIIEKINADEQIDIWYYEAIHPLYVFNLLDEICLYHDYDKSTITIHVKDLTLVHPEYKIKHDLPNTTVKLFNTNIDFREYNGEYDYGLFIGRADTTRMNCYMNHIRYQGNGLTSFQHNFYDLAATDAIGEYIQMNPKTWELDIKCIPYSDINDFMEPPIVKPMNSLGWESVYDRIPIEIVCETNLEPNSVALTEKTFRPMYYHRIPLFVGPVNYCRNLEKLGFDIFDDIINIDEIDNTSHGMRSVLVFEQLKKITRKYDTQKLIQDLKPRLIKNHNRVVEMGIDAMNELKKIGEVEI